MRVIGVSEKIAYFLRRWSSETTWVCMSATKAITRPQKESKADVSASGGNAGKVCQDQLRVIEHDAAKMRTEVVDMAPE